MSSFEIGILILLSYFCVYGIVNRICNCVESCVEKEYLAGWLEETEEG